MNTAGSSPLGNDPRRGTDHTNGLASSGPALAAQNARDTVSEPSEVWAEPPAWLLPRVTELVRAGHDEAGVLAMVAPELARAQLGDHATPELTRHVAEQFIVQPALTGVLRRLMDCIPRA